MNGEWTILLWMLVGVVFLVRIAPVRRIVSMMRQQPLLVQTVTVLILCLAFINGSTKTNSQNSASQIASPPSNNSSFIIENSSLSSGMPAGWNNDDTDTDADGIPDLWEKWTHGNRYVEDSAIDRDDDSLTDLEEFQNQTDPRTADTDGDGFSDALEVANGMNPVSAEDFTPVEPDTDQNGRIDLWENAPYYYGFTDTDHDGFDDYYENEILETASDENFDVVVTVYTTRSAVLTWDGGTNGIVLMPTTGQTVRLRLPFDADTELKLMPAPEGLSSPEAGGLWKAKLTLTFLPRTSQSARGSCIIASNGDISQKVVDTEKTITRFPDEEESMQTLSMDAGDGEWPKIVILRKRFFIIPESDVYHGVGDNIGPFDIVNTVNIDPEAVEWSASHGIMSPETGSYSSLTVTTLPDRDDPIVVTATVQLDESFSTNKTALVTRCPQHGSSFNFYTDNFSPQLGETNTFSATLPGCTHHNDPGWLEAEIVRETTAGPQHVAWVDMDASTEIIDRYGNASDLPSPSVFVWDGIAQVGLTLAEYEEVFTQGNHPFHLAAPAVSAGQPVPPPYYTQVIRLWNPGKSAVMAEESHKFYVPQVVQVKWQSEAEKLFRKPMFYYFNGQSNQVYSANYAGDLGVLMQDTIQRLRAYYPANINIRFVPFFSDDIKTTKFLFIEPEIRMLTNDFGKVVYMLGATRPIPSVQRSATGLSNCYQGSICDSTFNQYKDFAEGRTPSQPFQIPVNSTQMLEAVCRVSAHEVGHVLGLVDTYYLDGWSGNHNPGTTNIQTNMMNVSTDLKWMFNPHPAVGWRSLNRSYLEFVLPVPH